MTADYFLIDHDQNVKGGILWWIPLIIILLLVSLIVTRVDEKVESRSDKRSDIRKESFNNSVQKPNTGFSSSKTKINMNTKD